MTNYAIVVAAGKGERFGQPKQFYSFRGRPLLSYALDTFENNREINNIIIVVPKKRILQTKSLIRKCGYIKVRHVIAGGKRRQDSVLNGLKTIADKSGIVMIHDGIRPIISSNIIKKGIKLCRKYQAVIFGLPIYDTIKKINKNFVVKTVPRKDLYLIQTPQFFEIKMLKDAFKQANATIEHTDEAAMLESLRIPVYLAIGDRFNIKVTEKTDLKVLNKFLA